MSNWVVDSSVIVKWLVVESDSTAALRVVSETLAKSAKLFVLDLAIIEAKHVIWTHVHRKLLTVPEAHHAWTNLTKVSLNIVPSLPILDAAFAIAVQYDVAVYDALFVALARDLKIGGVTADIPLVNAVGQDFPEIVLLKTW